ncbi:hypothetical protein EO92_01325 [Methanosarcina sp. 2.H.A.1B.4]|jgi:hypothetical protein|nr:hypothetical protein EO92_01325 [Methanosarcina sp. 2.H.A.1B.4]
MRKCKLKKVDTVDDSNLKRSRLVEFTVKYEIKNNGNDIELHEIDANELATSLLGISNLLEEANSVLDVGSKLSIKVRGSFKPGSFIVDIASFYSTNIIQTVFNSGYEIGVIASVVGIVGFVHSAGNGIVNTLIWFCRLTKGKKILTKKPVGNDTSEVYVEGCNSPIIVNNLVLNLYEDKRSRQELEKTVSPLNNEKILDITFIVDGKEQEKILREERDYFSYISNETIEESEDISSFYITQANFDGKNIGWRFSFGDSSISQNKSSDFPVKILDEKFLKNVSTKKEIISNDGTAIIKARYKRTTHISEKLVTNWEILEVLGTVDSPKKYVKLELDDFN